MKAIKRISMLLCSVLLCSLLYAQTGTKTMNDLMEANDLYNEASEKKDYKLAESRLLNLQEVYYQLSESDQKEFDHIPAGILYDQACLYSLQNEKDKAIEALKNAIKAGYNDRNHIESDDDLENLKKDKRFIKLVESLPKKDTYTEILQKAGGYQQADTTGLLKFRYAVMTNPPLKHIREHFKLDTIAGMTDELSTIINLMKWVHNNVTHDGGHYPYCEHDAIDLYNYSKVNKQGVNCRMLAIILNEVYLSMGFRSRFVVCLPQTDFYKECHVINTVYSETLNKWVWMDATFNAYWKDENGILLSIEEVRSRTIEGKPLVLNPDANWNNRNKYNKKDYLDNYMAKNLYWFSCPLISSFNVESPYRGGKAERYVSLQPVGYAPDANFIDIVTHDPAYFWQAPLIKK